jgi:hypothetical protein
VTPVRLSPARWAVPGYASALTLAVAAPLLSPGYLLIRDAVSTPRSYLSDAALGIAEQAPRAVPQDAAVAVLSAVVDGGLVVKAVVFAALFCAGLGAGRLAGLLLPESGIPGQFVAVTVAVWNPFVAERLLQGHWSLLLGYGCLPWVAAAVIGLRQGEGPRRNGLWAAAVFWIALAGLTPTGLIMAAIVGLVCATTPGSGVGRMTTAATVLAVSLLAAAPWLTAAAMGTALGTPQAVGLAPFAARAEPGLGTLGSLAGLGGLWNAEAVPGSRTTPFAVVGTVVLLAVVACGVPTLVRRRVTEPLVILAVAAVLLPAAAATRPGMTVLRGAVDVVPALAIVRDAQKWVALAMPGYALAGAAAVLVLGRRVRPALGALACCAALLAVLPDLAWGVGGALRPVHYPPGWAAVAERINTDPRPVAVLPVGTMRRFGWSGPAPVLDPLPRWVRADVLTTGDLVIAGTTVPGEGGRARNVQRMLESGADPDALDSAGVSWLVVQRGTHGEMGDAGRTLQQLTPAYQDADIALYRVGGTSPVASPGKRIIAILAHLVWAAMVVGGAAALIAGRVRGARQSRGCP